MPSLKRKRESASTPATSKDQSEDLQSPTSRDAIDDIFRRHFEANFGGVELEPVSNGRTKDKKKDKKSSSTKSSKRKANDSEDDSDEEKDSEMDQDSEEGSQDDLELEESEDDSGEEEIESEDWDGLDSKDDGPEIVEYDFSRRGPTPSAKPSRSSFMSSKPPTSINSTTSTSKYKPKSKSSNEAEDTAAADALNLKNDLALHRLLRESHLLDSATLTHSSGKNRHKALESRIESLGGTAMSTLDGTASKVPMHIRKGMARKHDIREEKRRRLAKENGIVLARGDVSRKKTGKGGGGGERRKRDNGVGNPSVGRFKRGALVVSRKEVMRMKA